MGTFCFSRRRVPTSDRSKIATFQFWKTRSLKQFVGVIETILLRAPLCILLVGNRSDGHGTAAPGRRRHRHRRRRRNLSPRGPAGDVVRRGVELRPIRRLPSIGTGARRPTGAATSSRGSLPRGDALTGGGRRRGGGRERGWGRASEWSRRQGSPHLQATPFATETDGAGRRSFQHLSFRLSFLLIRSGTGGGGGGSGGGGRFAGGTRKRWGVRRKGRRRWQRVS